LSHKGRDRDETPSTLPAVAGRQRLDKWLWFARVVKTRTLAAKLVADGHVRVNAQRVTAPAKSVTNGDVLTIALERRVLILRVTAPGERRGPYEEARLLYEDLTPPEPAAATGGDAGYTPGGRPTKRERRALARWLDP
jgi:ribosome-associated heat shock protein Hsp15